MNNKKLFLYIVERLQVSKKRASTKKQLTQIIGCVLYQGQ